MSVSVYVTFGKFRTYHEGDLPKQKEFEVMCPNAKIASVDVLLGLHHGVATSNSPVMIHGTHPRVAIMNNGTRKGGDPDVMMALHTSPGLEDLWQIHFSALSGQEYTVPGMFIANTADDNPAAMPVAAIKAPAPGPNAPPPPAHNGKAYWIKLSAQSNGTFTVTKDITRWSKADIFSRVGKQTDCILRFSTVAGERGAADAERDVRGWALKFYTEEGNWDLVGNNTPVFFIRDPMKFQHFIRSQKRLPDSGLRDATMQWDFWTNTPESAHQVTYLMGPRGLPRTWREMSVRSMVISSPWTTTVTLQRNEPGLRPSSSSVPSAVYVPSGMVAMAARAWSSSERA